ncbi:peptidoglycan recognition protein family protein [Streptomyces venezuelae]|uniref:peptidoglycan recognition protein family protein n=1 Tax=Streptomyces sp. B6(2022) TaxID=3404749 RepID=UPI00311EAE9B
MAIIRRAQYGLPANSPAAYIAKTRGVKVHYLGTPYSSRPHSQCPAYVRQIRESHLANTKENYSDVAYNYLVCEHGDAFEGRGPHHRTGANGNAELNSQDYAVCALLGSSGLTQPTDAMLHGIRDAIEDLRKNGAAGDWIGGHRDGYATDCPGGPLYAWVQRGAPRPTKKPTPEEDPVMALSKEDVDRVALAVLAYRNKAADEKSKKLGRRIPDFYGYVVQTFTVVAGIAADVKRILTLLDAQKEK